MYTISSTGSRGYLVPAVILQQMSTKNTEPRRDFIVLKAEEKRSSVRCRRSQCCTESALSNAMSEFVAYSRPVSFSRFT